MLYPGSGYPGLYFPGAAIGTALPPEIFDFEVCIRLDEERTVSMVTSMTPAVDLHLGTAAVVHVLHTIEDDLAVVGVQSFRTDR